MMPVDWPALESANRSLNAFVDFDRAAAPGDGPLSDLTIGIKSNIAARGLPWTAGMALRREIVADRDAAVVEKLRAGGAAILGALNMHEAALGATTDNAWFGATHNPHRIGHTPGGSSGGSGAAVAAGLCDAALGTDTLGSVRIPAAYCGVYGLKPSSGAVDDTGLVFLARRYDCIGPLARTLDVLERVWWAIGPKNGAASPFVRLVTLRNHAGVELQSGIAAAFERARAAIDLPGDDIDLPDRPTALRLAALGEIARALIADLGSDRTTRADLISPELIFILNALENVAPAPDLLAATRKLLVETLSDDGVLLMPTTPQAAFPHGSQPPASQADFTGLANIAGLPALAVPAGRDADGLPVSVQLVGPAGSESRLIALARSLEPALGGAVLPEGVSP
jgi:aspartyl-tRNA(Asn)/glutamyl-tRNA(Gln) amidotransferase subunit A